MDLPLIAEGYCLRDFRIGDRLSLVRHANDPSVARWLRERFPSPYTGDDATLWIRRSLAEKPRRNFAIAYGDTAIGGIGLEAEKDVYRHSAELGYWLGKEYWGLGVATAAVSRMCEYAFRDLDLIRVHAGVFSPNVGSARVLEKAGFHYEGTKRGGVLKNGELMDELLYAKLRE